MTDNKQIKARLFATYELMSDDEGKAWMTQVLTHAVENNRIAEFEVLASSYGRFGIQLIIFRIDVLVDHDKSYSETEEFGERLLNEIIHDTDVNILWTAPAYPQFAAV